MQERSIESLIIAALAQRKAGHQYAICPHRGRGNEGLKVEGLDIRIIPKISGNSDERGSSWQTPSSGAVPQQRATATANAIASSDHSTTTRTPCPMPR